MNTNFSQRACLNVVPEYLNLKSNESKRTNKL